MRRSCLQVSIFMFKYIFNMCVCVRMHVWVGGWVVFTPIGQCICFKASLQNPHQEQLEMDTEVHSVRCMKKNDQLLFIKHTQSSNSLLVSEKVIISIMFHGYDYYLSCIHSAGSVGEASISFIPWFVIVIGRFHI
jgi:hypothetical protein